MKSWIINKNEAKFFVNLKNMLIIPSKWFPKLDYISLILQTVYYVLSIEFDRNFSEDWFNSSSPKQAKYEIIKKNFARCEIREMSYSFRFKVLLMVWPMYFVALGSSAAKYLLLCCFTSCTKINPSRITT